ERGEDVFLHVLFERLTADALNDVTGEADSVVGVSRDLAGRKDSVGLVVDEVIAERNSLLRIGEDDVVDDLLKAAGVRHEVTQGDGPIEGGADLEVEVAIDVGVEIELALLLQ